MRRLFVALELPAPVADALTHIRHRLQYHASHPVRWVDSHNYHLTLLFLGEVEEAHLPAIRAAVDTARASIHALPHLHLTTVGAFRSLRQPKTIWVGVGGNLPALQQCYQAVVDAMAPLGFAPDKPTFQPHITLGRTHRDASSNSIATLGRALEALEPPPPLAWQSEPPVLFQSVLQPAGPIYTKIG